jgi:hypothetical protein
LRFHIESTVIPVSFNCGVGFCLRGCGSCIITATVEQLCAYGHNRYRPSEAYFVFHE